MRRWFDRVLLNGAARLERAVAAARVRAAREHASLGAGAVLHPESKLLNLKGRPDDVRIGAQTQVRGELLVLAHGGAIEIGEWCYVGEGTRIWSAASVRVGDRVLIAHACNIHDWNAHPLDPTERHEHFRRIVGGGHPPDLDTTEAAPVVIEDDVWIGFNSIVLKGVRIGARSIVAAGSLVLDDVAADSLVGGVPARVIRKLG